MPRTDREERTRCSKGSQISYIKEPEPEISIPPVVAREEHHVSWPLSFLRGALKQLTFIVKTSVDNWEGLLFWNIFSLMSRVETISTQGPKTRSIYENYLCTSNSLGALQFIPLNRAPMLRWDLTKSAQSVNRFSRAGQGLKRKKKIRQHCNMTPASSETEEGVFFPKSVCISF